MPTYAQLEAEAAWRAEVVTSGMDWLGDELCRRTRRPRTAAGVKGDNRHLRGAHRSQRWIRTSRYCTNRTYTVQPGLTAEQENWLAGFDFNPGSTSEMIRQSKRIIAAMKAARLDGVIEFFGTVDGRTVTGWNNREDRAASSDNSHLWHWHITFDRRRCNDRALMERVLAVALGLPLEDDMTPEEHVWLRDVRNALLDPRNGFGDPKRNVVQLIKDVAWAVVNGNTETTWLGRTMQATAEAAGISPAELDEIAAAARAGAADAATTALAALTPDAVADAVVRALPTDQAKQVADELAARLAE